MKKTTINEAIAILQDAKNQMGGETLFCTFNCAGDKEYPTFLDTLVSIKGDDELEEIYLT